MYLGDVKDRAQTRKRAVQVVACLAVGLVAYGLLAVFAMGWAWPAPVVLPPTIKFNDNTYHRDSTCQPLGAYLDGKVPLHRVGSLPSALWFGERPIYSYTLPRNFSTTYDYVLVQDDGCYRYYQGNKVL